MTAVDIARLRSAVEILGSMVVGGHLMTEASQESMREKANEIMADLLGKTWDPQRGQWKSVNERTET